MPRRLRTVLLLAAGVMALGAVWKVVDLIRTVDHAERALHACLCTSNVVREFVERTKGRWPQSWSELEATVPECETGSMYDWPEDRAEVERLVEVDFQARPEQLARTTGSSFSAIRPVGTCYQSYDRRFSQIINALRHFHPDASGGREPADSPSGNRSETGSTE